MKTKVKFTKVLAILILAFLSTAILAQDKIYMPYFTISGMHSDYKVSSTKMLKTYIESTNRYQVVLANYIDTTSLDLSIEQTQKEASQVSANYFVLGDMNAVGNLLIISVKMYETSTSKLVWNDVVKASSLSDLDPSMQKIANTIGSVNKANADNDISTTTDYQSATNRTIFALSKNCISIEGGIVASSTLSSPFIYGIGYTRSFDVKQFIFNINGNYLWGDARCWRFDVGLIYPLNKKYISPYIGAALGLSSTGIEKKITQTYNYNGYISSNSYSEWVYGGGVELDLNGGILLMRNSSVGMKIGGTLSLPAYTVDNKYLPIGRLSVGISF